MTRGRESEEQRLEDARELAVPWKKWGPCEYFHGDNGEGIGASHQTGWTGLVAWLTKSLVVLDPKEVLEKGFDPASTRMTRGH